MPPVGSDDDARHIARPAHGILSRQKYRKVTAHGAVHGVRSTVCLHEWRVERDAAGDAFHLRDGHAHHEGDRARAVDGDDRLGMDAAGIGDK